MARVPALLAAAASLLAMGCATSASQAEVRRGLAEAAIPAEVADLWPEVQRFLDERGYELVGSDRAALGLPRRALLSRIFSSGHDTRIERNGSRVLETGEDARGVRVRARATPVLGRGCRVSFVAIQRSASDLSSFHEERDPELELVFLRRVAPEVAAQVEAREAGHPSARP
jgi:hypothetical protein